MVVYLRKLNPSKIFPSVYTYILIVALRCSLLGTDHAYNYYVTTTTIINVAYNYYSGIKAISNTDNRSGELLRF